MEWSNTIKAGSSGMCGFQDYYTIEDLYQAFKERLMEKLVAKNDELLNCARLEEKYENSQD
jgi:predicted nuclease with TOPRIM domain